MTIRVEGQNIFEDGDVSGDLLSEKILIAQTKGVVIQAEVTGSPDGSLIIEASSEMTEKSGNVTIWSQIHTETVLGVEDYLFFLKDAGYKWVRVRWDANGGSSGLINARFTFKGEW
jgi:hypothetical protein